MEFKIPAILGPAREGFHRSPVGEICLNPEPVIFLTPYPLVLLFLAGGGGFFLGTYGLAYPREWGFLIVVGISLLTFALFYCGLVTLRRSHQLRIEARKLEQAYRELESLRLSVDGYLTDLDRRTSKYFHCVTQTKVTAYFALRQINQELTMILGDFEELFKRVTEARIRAMYELVRAPFYYRDGFEISTGRSFSTTLAELPSIVRSLTSDLEIGLQELEAEIRMATDAIAPHNPHLRNPKR